MADFNAQVITSTLPGCGISLKMPHYPAVLEVMDEALWFEVHTENYCGIGGTKIAALRDVAERYPISFHGVGASLGGPSPLCQTHLSQVKRLVKQFNPALVSEHAVWSRLEQSYFADLLPLPRNRQIFRNLASGIQQYQECIQRPILIENPTHYLSMQHEMSEPDWLIELCRSTGCGVLLDITNLLLSEVNCGINARAYIDAMPASLIGELHIAGYSVDPIEGHALLIDSHDHAPQPEVLQLLAYALRRFGTRPVLLEWDDKIPTLTELLIQRRKIAALVKSETQENHVDA